MKTGFSLGLVLFTFAVSSVTAAPWPEILPGTQRLTMSGDIADQQVASVDRFLLDEIARSVETRIKYWERDTSSPLKYSASVQSNRGRLAHILGVRMERLKYSGPEIIHTTEKSPLVGRGSNFEVYAIRWPVLEGVNGEGLLLVPLGIAPVANFVVVPDADQLPEQIAGLSKGVPFESQIARRLAESGCRVVVPVLMDRQIKARKGRAKLTNRELIYRGTYELGAHVIGLELQKVLAIVDWFYAKSSPDATRVGVVGWGEGGLLALYAGALDERIRVVGVSGYFDSRQNIWQEPIDRNVFGLLEQFGDAELASLIAPRSLIIEAAKGPQVIIPPGTGGAPGRITTPALPVVRAEIQRAKSLVMGLKPEPVLELVISGDGNGPYGTPEFLKQILAKADSTLELAAAGEDPQNLHPEFVYQQRQDRQMEEMLRYSQWLLRESPDVRRNFFAKLDVSSRGKFEETVEWYRKFFYDEVIGRVDHPLLPSNARTRRIYDERDYTGYEVVLDVFTNVFAYGILLLPKDLKVGEKRPVVVCQHGLEGRPQDTIERTASYGIYRQFSSVLANRGFIVFAPQNLYIFNDRFRTLQRKANPIKKTLYSIITPQHQQIVDWLSTLPNVDPDRIGFYGISYGGKTAMRVPPLVTNYCLSICSGDFTEWVEKNASTRDKYMWHDEYEIFEHDLGSTFNYAEMATLIAPRPFMVETGFFDARNDMVGLEFAKIRLLYSGRLGIGDRAEIEWFVGDHLIHGVGTFDFLHKHLNWPKGWRSSRIEYE